jgi:hypothetical protein
MGHAFIRRMPFLPMLFILLAGCGEKSPRTNVSDGDSKRTITPWTWGAGAASLRSSHYKLELFVGTSSPVGALSGPGNRLILGPGAALVDHQ